MAEISSCTFKTKAVDAVEVQVFIGMFHSTRVHHFSATKGTEPCLLVVAFFNKERKCVFVSVMMC